MNESDLEYYVANKEQISEAKSNAVSKRTGVYAGLRNHGATCYLNSLIQCLFHDQDFVKLILEASDNPDSVIIKELKTLFARLLVSTNQSIDTEPLLVAFGWSKSQLFEQHDIHELFSVLLDALGKESAFLSAGIAKLFQGQLTDVLKCASCGHESRNASSFLNFSVDIPDATTDGTTAPSLQLRELLHRHLQPETLDAENKWLCSGCQNKVCAAKSQEYGQLPQDLVVHLKRFRYDPTTKRRRKLTTPIHFPLILNAAEAFGNATFGTYRLTGVVLHSGTALGGHYRSYVSSADGGWLDCNDSTVVPLTSEEVTQMFADPSAASADSAALSGGKGSFVHDNVYMLLYKAVADAAQPEAAMGIQLEELTPLIPDAIRSAVEAENEAFATRFRLQEIRQQVVALTVRVHTLTETTAPQSSVQLDLLRTTTIAAALQRAHAQLVQEGKLSATDYPLSQCRLRKYGKRNQSALGETFGDSADSVTLHDAGLGETATLALEVRTANDPEFAEFNLFDMNLRVAVWDGAEDKTDANHDVFVPGREAATVGELRNAIAAKLGVEAARVLIIHDDPATPLELLSADDVALVAQHRIYPGDNTLVVEVVPTTEDAASYKSAAFATLEEGRNKAVIYYNNPTDANAAVGATEDTVNPAGDAVAQRGSNYPFSIEVSVDITLAQFKALVAPTVGVADANTFYCKRSGAPSAPQLKDEQKTLRDLAFVNHSVIHLQLGQGCKSGEHLLRIEVDPTSPTAALQTLTGGGSSRSETANDGGEGAGIAAGGIAGAAGPVYVPLGDLVVSEKATVLQLKQQLCEQWAELAARSGDGSANATVHTPKSAAHIRLRDGKAGKISGPLRDDRIVGRCLLGLADGRRLIAQVLDDPEQIAADDLVISLRVASFDKRILYPAIDLPITRTSTMRAFYDKILALVPQLNEPLPPDYLEEFPAEAGTDTISLAKGFTTGPALTLKAAYKLKWDEPAVIEALNAPAPAQDATAVPIPVVTAEEASGDIDEATLERSKNLGSVSGLDRPPLNLRDGSIVVVRGKADFWRATLVMRARKAQEEALGENAPPRRPTTAGTGAAAARNRKSVKERVAAAAGGSAPGSAGGDGTEGEVLVKGGLPGATGGSSRRGGAEKGLSIATSGSAKERPPASADQLE